MNYYYLVLGILAVWRITHLLTSEDGPWQIIVRLRRLAGDGFWGELMDCFYCLSLWIAAPLAIAVGTGLKEKLLLWPALSAGAVLLERATARPEPAPTIYLEDMENQNVLRTEQTGHGPQ
jgi:hypothetical protein